MILAVLIILALLAFIGVLIWSVSEDAPNTRREVVLMSIGAVFVTLPSLALAIGAAT